MAVKYRAESVLTRLKQKAKIEGISLQTALQLFCQEEFLRKLAATQYAENLILKGGMFIYTLTEFHSRPTRDIDFMMRRLSNSLENIEQVMREICAVDTGNDFLTLEVLSTEQISLEKKYPGIKTKFLGHIGNVRVPFSIDIGIDDIIVPEPVKRKITTRLPDFDAPEIYTYTLESTIAEKFDAILQRMETTSRMKDFYDIYYLSEIFDFDGSTLQKAICATLEHRQRKIEPAVLDEIGDFVKNDYLNKRWAAFEPAKDAALTFAEAVERIELFLKPILACLEKNEICRLKWSCADKAWL